MPKIPEQEVDPILIVMTSKTYREILMELEIFYSSVEGIINHPSIRKIRELLRQAEEYSLNKGD